MELEATRADASCCKPVGSRNRQTKDGSLNWGRSQSLLLAI